MCCPRIRCFDVLQRVHKRRSWHPRITSNHLVSGNDFLDHRSNLSPFHYHCSCISANQLTDVFPARTMAAAASSTLREQKAALRKSMRGLLTTLSNDEIQAQCQSPSLLPNPHSTPHCSPALHGFSEEPPQSAGLLGDGSGNSRQSMVDSRDLETCFAALSYILLPLLSAAFAPASASAPALTPRILQRAR